MENLKELLQEAQHQLSRLQVLEQEYSQPNKIKGGVYTRRSLAIQNKLNDLKNKIENIHQSTVIHYNIIFEDNTIKRIFLDSRLTTEDVIFLVEYISRKQIRSVQTLMLITTGKLLNPRKSEDTLK